MLQGRLCDQNCVFHRWIQFVHSLKEYAPDCRWLNLRRLCENYINSDKEEISSIFYFSAIATWHHDQSKPQKHNRYISRLRQENVIPVLGKFKEKTIRCKVCSSTFKSHEEKRTDVNIALKMVSEAVLGTYDTAILVSGDTDIIPAISTIRDLSLQKRIGVLFPLGRFSNELKQIADFSMKIDRKVLLSSLFDADSAPEGWIPSN